MRQRQVGWALSDQALLSGINFLMGVMLARFLGAEEFGRYTLAWLIVLFMNSVRTTLIVSPMMSLAPQQEPAARAGYYGAVLVHQLLLGGFTSTLIVLGVLLTVLIAPEWGLLPIAIPLAAASFAFQLQDHLRRHFFSQDRPRRALIHDALAYGLQIGSLYLLLRYFGTDLDSVFLIIATSFAVGAAYGFVFIGKVSIEWRSCVDWFNRNWHSSKWLLWMSMLQWLNGNLLTFMAGALLGVGDVGGLRVCAALIGLTNILFIGLENVVPVRAAQLYRSGGLSALSSYIRQVSLAGFCVVGLLCLTIAAAPEFWVGTIYGTAYTEYAYLIRGYALNMTIMFFTLPFAAALRTVEKTRPLFSANVWATVAAAVLAYPLINLFGATGVVAGAVTLASIQAIYYYASWRSYLSQNSG